MVDFDNKKKKPEKTTTPRTPRKKTTRANPKFITDPPLSAISTDDLIELTVRYETMSRHFLRWVSTGKRLTAREDWEKFGKSFQKVTGIVPITYADWQQRH